jgi:hypothetical protein
MEGPLWEMLIPFWSVNKHGRHRTFLFLIVRFLKQFFLWNRWPNDMKLRKNQLWKLLYSNCSFRFDPLTNMAATGNSCIRLVAFFSETALPRRTEIWWEAPIGYGRFCIRFRRAEWKVSDTDSAQCSFSFGHCVVCSSSMYVFWYMLTLLSKRRFCP